MRTRIQEEYTVQWFGVMKGLQSRLVDDLLALCIMNTKESDALSYEDTHPLGYITDNDQVVIYNYVGSSELCYDQLAFTILYHKSADNKYRIVGVRVVPSSVNFVENDGKLMSRGTDASMILSQLSTVIFAYSVHFEESEIEYGSRWDIYLNRGPEKAIHWFSLTNSLLMALFLSVRSAARVNRRRSQESSFSGHCLETSSCTTPSLPIIPSSTLDGRRATRHDRRGRLEADSRRYIQTSRGRRCVCCVCGSGSECRRDESCIGPGFLHYGDGNCASSSRHLVTEVSRQHYDLSCDLVRVDGIPCWLFFGTSQLLLRREESPVADHPGRRSSSGNSRWSDCGDECSVVYRGIASVYPLQYS